MTPQEFRERMDNFFVERSIADDAAKETHLRQMAWRHGYGEMSSVYFDKYMGGISEINEDINGWALVAILAPFAGQIVYGINNAISGSVNDLRRKYNKWEGARETEKQFQHQSEKFQKWLMLKAKKSGKTYSYDLFVNIFYSEYVLKGISGMSLEKLQTPPYSDIFKELYNAYKTDADAIIAAGDKSPREMGGISENRASLMTDDPNDDINWNQMCATGVIIQNPAPGDYKLTILGKLDGTFDNSNAVMKRIREWMREQGTDVPVIYVGEGGVFKQIDKFGNIIRTMAETQSSLSEQENGLDTL
jgi:hypothetical protein